MKNHPALFLGAKRGCPMGVTRCCHGSGTYAGTFVALLLLSPQTSWQGQHSHQVRALLLTWQVGPWGGAPGRWGPGAGTWWGLLLHLVWVTGHLTCCHTLLSLCRGCHFCVSPEHGPESMDNSSSVTEEKKHAKKGKGNSGPGSAVPSVGGKLSPSGLRCPQT